MCFSRMVWTLNSKANMMAPLADADQHHEKLMCCLQEEKYNQLKIVSLLNNFNQTALIGNQYA
jgi:hypothetical protein